MKSTSFKMVHSCSTIVALFFASFIFIPRSSQKTMIVVKSGADKKQKQHPGLVMGIRIQSPLSYKLLRKATVFYGRGYCQYGRAIFLGKVLLNFC